MVVVVRWLSEIQKHLLLVGIPYLGAGCLVLLYYCMLCIAFLAKADLTSIVCAKSRV